MPENQPSPPLADLLAGIEADSGLSLCLKVLSPSPSANALTAGLPARYNQHLTPFCLSVKTTRNAQCRQCDLRDVPTLASGVPYPFVNRCHANASEIIIPIPSQASLAALAYLGQFRESAEQPVTLPLLSPERIRRLLQQALLLQRYFLYEIEHAQTAGSEEVLREHLIHQFLQTRLKQNPSLGDLSRTLGLSPSRAGHLIKELTGRSFVELKLHYRIEAACKMLTDTLFTIEHIAEETGFGDPRYFYRVFAESTGTTPARWRAKQRRTAKLQA